jgi:Tfp pilus assembly protein PilN
MPSINMIAARRAEKKKLEKTMQIAVLALLAEVAITLGLLGFMSARVFSASRTVRHLDSELNRVQPTVAKIKYYEAELNKLKPRLDLLADSREETLFWYTVLQDLSRSMPQSTWLSSITASRAAASSSSTTTKATAASSTTPRPTLSLRGVSANQRLIGETMLRLNQFSEFDQVNLNFTQASTDATREAVEFEMAVALKSKGVK